MRNFGKQCHSSYNRSPADTKGRGHPQPGPINVARNSLATTSNFEVTLLELQRFQRLLKLHPIELRAKFWKTVPQLTQQVARRHERPWTPADTKGRGHPGNAHSQASHGRVDDTSDVVGDAHRRVIGETLRVFVGAADLEGARTLPQRGRRVLVVDAPARVVDEGLTSP